MQILDDGRVTDSQGRVVSFKIAIMTSNLFRLLTERLKHLLLSLANIDCRSWMTAA